MYIYSHAGGDVILTNDTLTIPEGNSDNLCVQLIAGQGNPTMLAKDLVVQCFVSLDGKAGVYLDMQAENNPNVDNSLGSYISELQHL